MELNYLKVKDDSIQKEFMEKCGFEKLLAGMCWVTQTLTPVRETVSDY